jgi:xanthine dehydrogenase accessory factor
MAQLFEVLADCLEKNEMVSLATVVEGKYLGAKLLIWPGDAKTMGTLGNVALDRQTVAAALNQMDKLESSRVKIDLEGEPVDIFIDVYPPPLKLIIVGAVHIAIPLVALAKVVGIYTIVIDARSAFATRERFPHADELLVKWPAEALQEINLNESTCIVTLTHDEKFDNPALDLAVHSRAHYIGALGSQRTHSKRVEALKKMGVSADQIARIHAPIGLDIGAKSTEEIALAILAQIVAVLHGKAA